MLPPPDQRAAVKTLNNHSCQIAPASNRRGTRPVLLLLPSGFCLAARPQFCPLLCRLFLFRALRRYASGVVCFNLSCKALLNRILQKLETRAGSKDPRSKLRGIGGTGSVPVREERDASPFAEADDTEVVPPENTKPKQASGNRTHRN